MSLELDNPTGELAIVLRSLVMVAANMGEVLARRRELALREAARAQTGTRREIASRIAAEQRVAEAALGRVAPAVRALDDLDPHRLAEAYQQATAWRDRSEIAREVAGRIENHLHRFGIDTDTLRAAARTHAQRAEPGPDPSPGFDPARAAAAAATATQDPPVVTGELDTEQRALRALLTAPPDLRRVADDLDRADRAAAREHYRRLQGLRDGDPVTDTAYRVWRAQQARDWFGRSGFADLALYRYLAATTPGAAVATLGGVDTATALTGLWEQARLREHTGLPLPDPTEASPAAYAAELDTAHTWARQHAPDWYREWASARPTDPDRADVHLADAYRTRRAYEWATSIGEDLWKHGFARTAATLSADGEVHDLDDVVRQVWVDAGRPAPTPGRGLSGTEASVAIRHRWDSELDAAHDWARHEDPAAYAQWQHWHTGPDTSSPRRDAAAARLAADLHTEHARRWAHAAETRGESPTGTAHLGEPALLATWRHHTTRPTDPEPQPQQPGAGQSEPSHDTPADVSAVARPQPTRSLAEHLKDTVPERILKADSWARAETAYTRLVEDGADEHHLADAVARLDFGKARSPAALAMWRLRDTAVAQGLHDPTQPTTSEPGRTGPEAEPSATRVEWDSPERRNRLQRRLERDTDPDTVQARVDADLGQATPPDNAVDNQPRPTRSRARTTNGPSHSRDRSRGF